MEPKKTGTEYEFPPRLAERVKELWDSYVSGPEYDRPTLPVEIQLLHILNTAYLASQVTDEGRHLKFSLCCIPSGTPVRVHNRDAAVESWAFETDRPLNVQEVRRLAAATDLNSSAIWVSFSGDSMEGLTIHGLINTGFSWSKAKAGLSYQYVDLPSALIVRVEGVGRINVLQGTYSLATLHQGKVVSLSPVPIIEMLGASRLFSQGWESLRRFIPPPQHEHPKEWSDFEYTAYVNVIIAILNAIQRSGHGGAVVLASQSAPFASEQSSPVRIKYRFASGSDSLQKLFVEFMKARHQLADFINLKESGDPNTSDKDVKSAVHDASVAELKLADTCTFVGKLSGTDGAIVLNSDLTLFGFGTEILLDKRIDLPVYEVENPIAKEEKHQIDGEQYGMRHRSAMRLCTNVTDIVVFVVSQDGDVSITWRQWGDNEVYFKKGIRITNMNMPG